MWNKILRRSLLIIPQLLAFSLLVFALAQWMPGDPLTGRIIQGMDQGSMTATLGNPGYVRYLQWIGNMLNGDFGLSYTYLMLVEVLIGARLGNTLFLAAGALLFVYVVALQLSSS